MNSLLLTLSLAAAASVPAQPPAPPQLSPLLYIKVIGPVGMKVKFHPGTSGERAFDAPAIVGVRPGYVYRLELTLPQMPKVKLYPSLEVRGALQTTLAQAQRHPVPIQFLEDEIRRVDQSGSMIGKVHYLEDPAQASPIASKPDEPLIIDVGNDVDPLQEARSKGRPMVVVRLGEKEPDRDELVRFAVPNTILFPREQRLPLPPVPPQVPWLYLPIYDPIAGARRSDEECLPDGGDTGLKIGIAPDGELGGFNPSDTAVVYSAKDGRRKVAISNRVCILAPRYVVARQEVVLSSGKLVLSPDVARSGRATASANSKQTALANEGSTHLAGAISRLGVGSMQSRVKLHGFENVRGVRVIGTVAGLKVVGQVSEPDEITAYPLNEPLSLFKWADPKEAEIGDTVTFYLRYHNHTKHPVENLIISDSLTARLEYIAGSARSDREAGLTVQPNEAGSLILRWEISGKIPPGEKGIVAFQAKIR